MDRGRTRVEVAYQVEHAVADTGRVDADVLHIETLGKFLDLFGLILERLPAPTVFFQDAEFCPGLQRRGDHHARGVVAGSAGIVAKPHRAVAEWAI